MDVPKDHLICLNGRVNLPHVVILGAGASIASFPSGDRFGRRLPLMRNLVEVLSLEEELQQKHPELHDDFEALYSKLHDEDPNGLILRQIERRVEDYFERLEMPHYPTLYDMLLLSLREKDAVFTFNWDPFLFDAHRRLTGVAPLPQIYHLHGNVRIALCDSCDEFGERGMPCKSCQSTVTPVPLLYPVSEKSYGARFVKRQWEAVEQMLTKAGIVTIFGYSAPVTDQRAKDLFMNAWKPGGTDSKLIERVEVIDIEDEAELSDRWQPFSHYRHITFHRSFFDSLLAIYPRRT